jgi:alpha-tubulin suppressor-like RCC1 family protein
MRSSLLIAVNFVFACLSGIILFCVSSPNDPYDKSNTGIFLFAKSFGHPDAAMHFFEDSVSNRISFGVASNFPNYLDSIRLVRIVSATHDSVLKKISIPPELEYMDTLWDSLVFYDSGSHLIEAKAFINNGKTVSDSLTLKIHSKPANHKPKLSFSGRTTIDSAGACILTVAVVDTDLTQKDSVYLLYGPAESNLAEKIFTWTAPEGFVGQDSAIFVAKDNGYPPMYDTLRVIITVKGKESSNHAPKWSGDTLQLRTSAGDTLYLTLSDKCADPDGDRLLFALLSGIPSGDTITSNAYSFAPMTSDTGAYWVRIAASDSAGLADTLTLQVIVTSGDRIPPEMYILSPSKDTIVAVDSCFIRVICKDESGIGSVIAMRDSTVFQCIKSAIMDSVWTCAIKGFTPLQYARVTVIATDASPAKNRDSINLRIKYDNDTAKPVIALATPVKDSISTNASSFSIAVQCTDTSGVLSVNGRLGAKTFTGTRSANTTWTMTATDLVQGVFNAITITATDSSLRANQAALALHIKYDSTMLDSLGPVIFQKSGPAGGSVVTDPIISIVDSIVDPNGVDSVYWTLNGTRGGYMAPQIGSASNFVLRDTLTKFRQNRIVIHALDNSTRHNRDSAMVLLDYNLPPVINDTSVSTNRNAAKTWKLDAMSPDSDTLVWQRLTSPSALSGTITGTLPNVTFTPTANWAGVDSFYVKISDGYWSDSAKIKITVIDVPVAPSIVTQPAGGTKNIGQSITFTVAINADVNPAPSYQWKHNGTPIPSANAASYTIGSIAILDSGAYTVTITNGAGTVTSAPAVLTVNYAPSIITQPFSQTLYLGKSATFSVVATGSPALDYVWRKNGAIITGATGSSHTIASPGVDDSGKYTVTVTNTLGTVISDTVKYYAIVKSVSAGNNHSLFVKTDGTLWACGDNSSGQLGDGTNNGFTTPKQVMTNVQDAAAGYNLTLIVKTNGELQACGLNGDSRPVTVMQNVQSATTYAGGGHILILQTDGTLWAFGTNSDGQLGDSTTTDRSSPVPIMAGVQYIAAGYNFSLAVKTDGSLWGWGANDQGQLGDSTTAGHLKPVKNTKITGKVQNIAAGYAHSLIQMTDGTLWGCGANNLYNLGLGDTISNAIVPIKIMAGVKSMSGGGPTHILQNNGSLWGCGTNSQGQLGKSDPYGLYKIPVEIIANSVQAVASGPYHSIILTTNGRVSTTGWNGNGQLGNGDSGGGNQYGFVQISFY